MAGKLRPGTGSREVRPIVYNNGTAYIGETPVWAVIRKQNDGVPARAIQEAFNLHADELAAISEHAARYPNEIARDLRLNR